MFLARRRGGLLASGLGSETVGTRSPTSCSRIVKGITKRRAAKRSGKLLTIGSGTMRTVRFFSLRFVGLWSRPEPEPSPFPGGSVDVRHAGVCEGRRGRSTVLCGAGALSWWWGGNFGRRCPRQKKRDLVRRSAGHCACPLTKRKESCAAATSKPPSPDSTAFGSLFTTCFSLLPGRRKQQQPPRGWWRVVACHLVCGVHNFLNCCLCFFCFFSFGLFIYRGGGWEVASMCSSSPSSRSFGPSPAKWGGRRASAEGVHTVPAKCVLLRFLLSALRSPPRSLICGSLRRIPVFSPVPHFLEVPPLRLPSFSHFATSL